MTEEQTRDERLGQHVQRFKKTPHFVKLRAMQIYAEHGPEVAARQLSVNRKTIDRWRHELGLPSRRAVPIDKADVEAATRQVIALRADMRGMYIQKARMLLNMMTDDRSPTGLRDLALALDTLMKSFRLEMGEATEHSVKESLFTDLTPQQRIKVLKDLRSAVTTRSANDVAGTVDGVAERVADQPA